MPEAKIRYSHEQFSVTGGHYQDPHPNIVEWINNKFKDPQDNIHATVLKAFEIAGVIKKERDIKKLVKPLEKSGLLPTQTSEGEVIYQVEQTSNSPFIDRREEQLFLEFQKGQDIRNQVLLTIMKKTSERLTLGPDEISKLRAEGRKFVGSHNFVPPVAKIIAVMVGIMSPQDPKNKPKSEAPPLTNEAALDVYWLMLRDELNESKVKEPTKAEEVA